MTIKKYIHIGWKDWLLSVPASLVGGLGFYLINFKSMNFLMALILSVLLIGTTFTIQGYMLTKYRKWLFKKKIW